MTAAGYRLGRRDADWARGTRGLIVGRGFEQISNLSELEVSLDLDLARSAGLRPGVLAAVICGGPGRRPAFRATIHRQRQRIMLSFA